MQQIWLPLHEQVDVPGHTTSLALLWRNPVLAQESVRVSGAAASPLPASDFVVTGSEDEHAAVAATKVVHSANANS